MLSTRLQEIKNKLSTKVLSDEDEQLLNIINNINTLEQRVVNAHSNNNLRFITESIYRPGGVEICGVCGKTLK